MKFMNLVSFLLPLIFCGPLTSVVSADEINLGDFKESAIADGKKNCTSNDLEVGEITVTETPNGVSVSVECKSTKSPVVFCPSIPSQEGDEPFNIHPEEGGGFCPLIPQG